MQKCGTGSPDADNCSQRLTTPSASIVLNCTVMGHLPAGLSDRSPSPTPECLAPTAGAPHPRPPQCQPGDALGDKAFPRSSTP